MYEPGTRRLTTDRPGATTSGRRFALPALENGLTTSSAGEYVPLTSLAQTARTNGSIAGLSSDDASAPRLPAAADTTMPLRHATSAGYDSGSSWYGCRPSVPYARLST